MYRVAFSRAIGPQPSYSRALGLNRGDPVFDREVTLMGSFLTVMCTVIVVSFCRHISYLCTYSVLTMYYVSLCHSRKTLDAFSFAVCHDYSVPKLC